MSGVEAFMDRLFQAVPPVRQEWEAYARSRRHDEADAGASPSIGGFLRRLVLSSEDRFRSGNVVLAAQLHGLFEFFESELGGDPEIDELIETGFAAYLPEPGDPAAGMLQLLGPKLGAARTRQLQEDDLAVPASTVEFLRRLAEAVPSLRERVAEHFERLNNRPLPHAFVGEIVFEGVDLVASGQPDLVRPLLGFLEAEYGVDDDVDNVIDVSFVEMLPNPGEPGVEIVGLLGPKLRAEYERHQNWSD